MGVGKNGSIPGDWGIPRIELGTTRTQSENHSTRPNALVCPVSVLSLLNALLLILTSSFVKAVDFSEIGFFLFGGGGVNIPFIE